MEKIRIKNPWYNPRWSGREYYEGTLNKREWNGFQFVNLPCSVLAIKDGVVVIECVTIDGAIRHLEQTKGV